MSCLYPYAVKNPRGNFRSEAGWIPVPCGKCPSCLQSRSNSWLLRLLEEEKVCQRSYFVTATYAPHSCPVSANGFKTLDKSDFQKFIKRLRKISSRVLETRNGINCIGSVRYYCAGEYGTKFSRPHYHAIIFNAKQADIEKAWTEQVGVAGVDRLPIGDIRCDKVEGASISYTLKYIHKGRTVPCHVNDDRQPEFSLMSKGLGISYLTEEKIQYHLQDKTRFYGTLPGGIKIPLPRYLRDRIYSEEDRIAYAKIIAKTQDFEEAKRFLDSGLTRFEYDRSKHEAKKASITNFKNRSKR